MSPLDWKAGYACTAAMQAFIYGFPYTRNARLRHDGVTQARDPAVIPYAAVNCFWRATRVLDATYRDGGCPDNDTLYSPAWLDLGGGLVILSHPDMAGRYFTGSKAGHCAFCGPGWHRDLPPEAKTVQPAPTPRVLLLGRTPVSGDADLATVHALQALCRLTPLSLSGKPGVQVPECRDTYAPNKT